MSLKITTKVPENLMVRRQAFIYFPFGIPFFQVLLLLVLGWVNLLPVFFVKHVLRHPLPQSLG